MRPFRITTLLLTLALFGLAGTAVYAQQGPAGSQYGDMMGYDNPQGPGGAPSAEKQEQVRKKIETVRIWRLTEALKLDTATSAKLASLLSSYDQQRRDTMRERREAMRELRLMLKAKKPDTEKIKTLLDKLENNHRATQEIIDKEWKGLQEILTPEQQARFVVFQQDFKREIHRMIAGARHGQGKGSMGRGPGAGNSQPGTPQNK